MTTRRNVTTAPSSTSASPTSTLLSSTSTLTTPSYPSKGIFTIHSSASISASPSTCVLTTLTPSTYPSWNAFVPHIQITSQPPSSTTTLLPSIPQLQSSSPSTLQLGSRFTMTAFMDGADLTDMGSTKPGAKGSRPNLELLSILEEIEKEGEKGYRICWMPPPGTFAGGSWAMWCERVQEFVGDGNGGTKYETWETFHGPLAYIIKWFFGGKLVERFMDWTAGLKKFCEGPDALRE